MNRFLAALAISAFALTTSAPVVMAAHISGISQGDQIQTVATKKKKAKKAKKVSSVAGAAVVA